MTDSVLEIVVEQIPYSGVGQIRTRNSRRTDTELRRRTDSELVIVVGQIPNSSVGQIPKTGVRQIPNTGVGQIQLSHVNDWYLLSSFHDVIPF